MKLVWAKAKEYGVNTKALAERIITQMLFSENVFGEEAIFEDYYIGKPYFRLKQAYLAYIARMYVVYERCISGDMIRLMIQEYRQQEFLADICKAAIVKYYAGQEVDSQNAWMLQEYFRDLCSKGMVFPFCLSYPQALLKEVQLYDKVMVDYCAKIGGKVKIFYRILREGEPVDEYQAETLLPLYEKMYVKEFVLYEGEILQYYFEEIAQEERTVTEKSECSKTNIVYEDGKYGRLSLISRLSREKQYEAMLHYKKEEAVAKELFQTY